MRTQTLQHTQTIQAQTMVQNRRRTDLDNINWQAVSALAFLVAFWIGVTQVF